jgi:hypothetical protein
MSDPWFDSFLRTKQDISELFYHISTTILPEKSTSTRSWNYSLKSPPSEQVEVILLIYYMLSSMYIANFANQICRMLSKSKILIISTSILTNAWAFFGDTWVDVTCALDRRKISYPKQLNDTFGKVIHNGLMSTGTTIYLLACLLLFRNLVVSRGATEKIAAYFRLCLAFVGLMWFGIVEGIDEQTLCRNLLSHLMHAVLTNGLFLLVVVTACGTVVKEFGKENKKKKM